MIDFEAIAVDLPAYGQSSQLTEEINTKKFMKNLIENVGIFKNGKIIILTPSIFGRFSLPLMSESSQISGYIPIAPIWTEQFPIENYKGTFY